jgi:hypothetical protein
MFLKQAQNMKSYTSKSLHSLLLPSSSTRSFTRSDSTSLQAAIERTQAEAKL